MSVMLACFSRITEHISNAKKILAAWKGNAAADPSL